MTRKTGTFWVRHKTHILIALYVLVFFVLPWFFFMGQEDFDVTLIGGLE